MAWFRTTRRLVPWLIGLFLVAQFAGVAPFREEASDPPPTPASTLLQAEHVHGDHGRQQAAGAVHHHHDNGQGASGACCALHGLTAIVTVVAATLPVGLVGERMVAGRMTRVAGISPGRLDRPPRTLLLI